MEKALIEKMNGDMKEIQVLWEKVGNSEDDKKTFNEKIENCAAVYRDFAIFFSEYNMSIVTQEDFSKVRNLINQLHKEIKKENPDKSDIEKVIGELWEIRITGTDRLSEEIMKKGKDDFRKLEQIIKDKNWEKEREFIQERRDHYNKIKIWFDENILRDLELYTGIFDTMVNFDISMRQIEKNKEPYIFVSED